MILHLFKKFVMICFWRHAKDPVDPETTLNIFYVITVVIAEIVWYVYGNMIFYSDDMGPCKNDVDAIGKTLWITMHILIIGSYIYAFFLFVIFIILCIALILHCVWKHADTRSLNWSNKPI